MNSRLLSLKDADRMAQIHKESFPAGWPSEEMALHIKKDLCLGVADPLAAFALFQVGGDQADILTIACAPDQRRKGYARLLLEAGENALAARGVETLYLDVSERNNNAITLYKNCGYHPIGRRPAYYRTAAGRVAALTFSKTLNKG